ncbi:hypothetical protein BX600DRAFT_505837 [Xylariales sp. PMI_506]|nr:hypothetical protein BX600DRAFT_505837 [Xylariales sp. PMI_506]
MESPTSARGRGRFASRKRNTFPTGRSSSQLRSEPAENPASTTPAPLGTQPSAAMTYETPSPSNARGTRRGARNVDGVIPSPDEAGSKGGRSLRKRARIDYSFGQADEEDTNSIEAKTTPAVSRSIKKRRTDSSILDEDIDEEFESAIKRRASEQPPRSAIRRNIMRKSTVEPHPFIDNQDDDVAVQDTIEVGGHQSERASDSSFHHRRSSGSSPKEPETLVHSPYEDQMRELSPLPPSLSNDVTEPSSQPEKEVKSESYHDNAIPNIKDEDVPFSMLSQDPQPKLPEDQLPEVAMADTEMLDVEETDAAQPEPELPKAQLNQPQPQEEPPVPPSIRTSADVEEKKKEEENQEGEKQEEVATIEMQVTEKEQEIMQQQQEEEEDHEDHEEEEEEDDDDEEAEVKAQEPQPVKAQEPEQVKAQEPEHVKAQEPEQVKVQESEQVKVQEPEQVKVQEKEHEEEDLNDPFSHLTPYIAGARVYYPATQTEAQDGDAEPDTVPDEAGAEEAIEEPNEAAEDDTPAASPGGPEETAANSPAPDASNEVDTPETPAGAIKKQYPFKKTRSAQDFIDLFADIDALPQEELYARLEVASMALASWQNEFNELRKDIDDEDNAARYQQEENAYLHREKMAVSKDPNANPLRKDFIIKGIKAPKPDPIVAYNKQQDRVMANAYLFDYDDRDTKVGQQDPIGQRGGVGKGRLRDRPKQTAKAAEADDGTVVHGKRARKAPNLFGDTEPASRGSTPVPMPSRRRRGRQAADENGDGPSSQPDHAGEDTPRRRGRGGRPRKQHLPAAIPEDLPAGADDDDRTSRKRRRKHNDDDDLGSSFANGSFSSHAASRRRNSRVIDGPSGSFYSTHSMTSNQVDEDARPLTSSSTATASTTVSTYGLREKRQKHFADDDDDDDFEDEEEEPKPKRIRRAPKKVQEQNFAGIPASIIPQEGTSLPPPKIPKIKVKGYTASTTPASGSASGSKPGSLPTSSGSTPGQTANGNGNGNGNGLPTTDPLFGKDYGQMTKSEKMSYSMKARWASGSMSPAVAKRRATLAAKKAAAKTPATGATPEGNTDQQ